MEISQKLLCLLLLVSLATGFALGIVYDLLWAIRVMLGVSQGKPSKVTNTRHHQRQRFYNVIGHVVLFWEDLLFMLLGGVAGILILYILNDGRVRWMVPLGMGGGFFAYMVTLSRCVRWLCRVLMRFVYRILKAIFKCLSVPLKWLYSILNWLILRHWRNLFTKIRKAYQSQKTKKLQESFNENDAMPCGEDGHDCIPQA